MSFTMSYRKSYHSQWQPFFFRRSRTHGCTLHRISSKKMDHMYRVQESSAVFLYTHPKPNSMVVASSTKSSHTALSDKDSRRIDAYGKRFYATGSLGIKALDYLACMARFVYAVLDDFSAVIPHLPEALRAQALQLQTDGLAVVRQQLNTTKHILESSARTLSLQQEH